jgi:germination protein M
VKKIICAALVIFLVAGALAGCRREQVASETSENIQLFYGDANNERMVAEEREIRYGKCDDKYTVVLEELIQGPTDENLTANISPATEVYGTILQPQEIIVNFSQEFARFGGSVAEIIGVGSVVNTLTQFDGIERVKILVAGEELRHPGDEPYGFMETYPLNPEEATTARDVLLYFSNEQATAIVGENRQVHVFRGISDQDMTLRVLQELIEGPQSQDLRAVIPPEATVRSVNIADGISHVDFSEEMHTKHWGGAAGEAMTINSLVYTLTEFDFIDRVKISVMEGPLNIEHVILEEPVGREDIR